MSKANKLAGLKLKVLSISRQNMIDAEYVGICENCGKPIVNIATVQDIQTNTKYDIGLDCKKTLIDKPIIDSYNTTKELLPYHVYDIKEYKRDQNFLAKFLLICSDPTNKISLSKFGNQQNIIIRDNKPHKDFPQVIGNIIIDESIGYLYKIGLKDFIEKLHEKKLITFE